MFDLKLLFVCLLAAITVVLTQDEAVPKLTDGRIVGGVTVRPHEFPSMVSVHLYKKHYCGGTLLSGKAVLTAAHCVYGFNTSSLFVVAGAHNLNSPSGSEVWGDVSRIIMYPSYDPRSVEHDIALIILTNWISTVPGKIEYGRLSYNNPTDGESLTAVGWGRTQQGGHLSPVLQKVSVPYVPNNVCSKSYPGSIKPGMMCAGKEEGGADACQGDSGGPLFREDKTQIGITSWGYGCAQPNFPGVYTRVSYYVNWINSNLP